MVKKIMLILMIMPLLCVSQKNYTIEGYFKSFPNSAFELKGYTGLQQTTLSTSKSKENGTFALSYSKDYKGVALKNKF